MMYSLMMANADVIQEGVPFHQFLGPIRINYVDIIEDVQFNGVELFVWHRGWRTLNADGK